MKRSHVLLFVMMFMMGCITTNVIRNGYVDTKGNVVIIPQFEEASFFHEDLTAGVQILLPAVVTPGTACTVANDCFLWVRGQWYLVGALINILWVPVESGLIKVSRWDTELGMFSIEFSGSTLEEPLYGSIKVSRRSRCEDHIR